jgi:membrane-associated phospholipid phosphatase
VREHLRLFLIATALYMLYHPIAHLSATWEAHAPVLPIDRATPWVPEWIYVYALIFVMAPAPLLLIRWTPLFRRIFWAYIAIEGVALLLFVAVPVRMVLRPEGYAVDSFVRWGVALCYSLDQPMCCFPSLHVAMASLSALSCYRAHRIVGSVLGLVAIAIGASTMLVKQHYFADVVSGFGIAAGAYVWLVARFKVPDASVLCYPARRVLWLPVGYALMVLGCYAAYQWSR